MTPEFAYFLKVNVAFVLLYAFYRLLFYKDTFFKLRRTLLLASFALSLSYPLFNIQDWVREQEPIAGVIQIYSSMLPEVAVMPDDVPVVDWKSLTSEIFLYVYLAVALFLVIRFLVQLGRILLLGHQCKKAVIQGVSVCLLNKQAGPFSFFRHIFIHPAGLSEKEISEILAHECTHASQWHSIDVLLSELIGIVCWVNPFVWLLKREVRHNLEYLADDTVLEAGYDSRSYQYHLLGLAHSGRTGTALFNNFNIIHIKNRISMMNKKRSRSIGRTKYLAFLPMAALLMLVSNIEAVARVTKDFTSVALEGSNVLAGQPESKIVVTVFVVDKLSKPVPGVTVVVKGSEQKVVTDDKGKCTIKGAANEELLLTAPQYKEREYVLKGTNTVKIIMLKEEKHEISNGENAPKAVEQEPEFPGGPSALMQFISKNVKYPVDAQTKGIQGRVTYCFTIKTDGSITDIELLKGVDPLLDAEALRVIKSMPKWKPAMNKGKAVEIKHTVPVTFRLQ